jgi:hypothetical protein
MNIRNPHYLARTQAEAHTLSNSIGTTTISFNAHEQEIHDIYCSILDIGKAVYFAKFDQKTADGNNLIKIGSTGNLARRVSDLKYIYGELIIIKAFKCEMHTEFERFLHKHPNISGYKYNEKINGNTSTEIFKMDNETIRASIALAESLLASDFSDKTQLMIASLRNEVNELQNKLLER